MNEEEWPSVMQMNVDFFINKTMSPLAQTEEMLKTLKGEKKSVGKCLLIYSHPALLLNKHFSTPAGPTPGRTPFEVSKVLCELGPRSVSG